MSAATVRPLVFATATALKQAERLDVQRPLENLIADMIAQGRVVHGGNDGFEDRARGQSRPQREGRREEASRFVTEVVARDRGLPTERQDPVSERGLGARGRGRAARLDVDDVDGLGGPPTCAECGRYLLVEAALAPARFVCASLRARSGAPRASTRSG